jgi:transketolase
MQSLEACSKKAADLAKLAVRMTTAAGSGHPSSALSLAHLVTYLMYEHMRWDPKNPWDANSDRLVLSEGHAVPIAYAAFADIGAVIGNNPDTARPLTINDVDTLRDLNSPLDGHPNPAEQFPFFDGATGSLGMGLSLAAGLGLAARTDKTQRRIYCIIGDGESREGQIWEACDFLIDYALTNVITIFNCNREGQAANVSQQQSADVLAKKLTAFGFEVQEIDGHDPAQISAAILHSERVQRPMAIVASTVKGWGCNALRQGNWHGKPLPESELEAAYKSLDQAAPDTAEALKPPIAPDQTQIITRPNPRAVDWPSFEDAAMDIGLGGALDSGKLATRRAYGVALKTAGDLLPQVVALDGDVSNSTFANFFASAHPERFYECKIAEQNMVTVAAGLAASGYIPFANSFAKFLSRAYDQVELANISRSNVKLVGSHAGISLAADGPSQMALVDVAFFRSLGTVAGDDRESPMCWFFQPADAYAAYACTRLMIEIRGLCYMRTHRPDVPLLYKSDTRFEPGGFHVLNGGEDLALLGSGYTVHVAREAAELLVQQNIRASVIDLYSYPFDQAKLLDAIRANGKRALVIEDNLGGGMYSAVAEAAAQNGDIPIRGITISKMPKSAHTPAEILDYCGVSPTQVADHAKAALAS